VFSSGDEDDDVPGGFDGELIAAVHGPLGGQWGNSVARFSNSPYYRDGVYRTTDGYDFGDPDGRRWGPSHVRGTRGVRRDRKPPTVAMCGSSGARLGCVVTGGGLDKAIIRRHIKAQLRRIEHCYERELIARPGLGGTIRSTFTISPVGVVQGITSDGMGLDSLHACVSGVIGAIQFPRSTDGDAVRVNYPFHFHAAGES
jgi:hypothetical protein